MEQTGLIDRLIEYTVMGQELSIGGALLQVISPASENLQNLGALQEKEGIRRQLQPRHTGDFRAESERPAEYRYQK